MTTLFNDEYLVEQFINAERHQAAKEAAKKAAKEAATETEMKMLRLIKEGYTVEEIEQMIQDRKAKDLKTPLHP